MVKQTILNKTQDKIIEELIVRCRKHLNALCDNGKKVLALTRTMYKEPGYVF